MNPTERFSDRVENYIKHRPGYPEAAVNHLCERCGLEPRHDIADIGSGTGIASEPFLRRGHRVWGVEPNREMRQAAERLLQRYTRFVSTAGTAEATQLADRSVDFVIAAQAFHWFRRQETHVELRRILRQASGWVALLWNARRTSSTPFLQAYEQLLRAYATDYARVNHADIPRPEIRAFFRADTHQFTTFANAQELDCDGLTGRLLSSSYTPPAGHPQHEPMLRELHSIFAAHRNAAGRVVIEYDTEVHLGQLAAEGSA